MDNKEKKLTVLSEEYNGHFTTNQLLLCGFSKYDISQFVKHNVLERVSRGKYVYKDAFDDEFKLIQLNNSKMIYSNETALYLHDLTGRFPIEFSVTTTSGYHLRNTSLKIYYVKPELLYLGMIEMKDYFGNNIFVYDKERTICDIIKNKNRIETQIYLEGLQNYFLNSKPNYMKLSEYAKELSIFNKVMEIVQLFSSP